MAYVQSIGAVCPTCSFHNGVTCVPCPEGSDMLECFDCEGGELPVETVSWWDRSKFWAPMVVTVAGAVLSTVAIAVVMSRMDKKRKLGLI